MNKEDISIACVDNMNNSMFSLARHLRHKGYAAKLILTADLGHFKPEADTFEEIDTRFIVRIDLINSDIINLDKQKIKEFFSGFDFIIACGFSVAYLTAANIFIDVVIPYGSDIYELPFFEPKSSNNIYFNAQRKIVSLYQKMGIESAKALIIDYTNEEFEAVLQQFNLKGKRYKVSPPFLYTPEFKVENINKLRNKAINSKKMELIQSQFEFIIFNHGRQSWKNPEDKWSYKGNERVFGAFKAFLEQTVASACLIVFEYGPDVVNSKSLCLDLGIDKNVIWFPISERKEILGMISYADVGVGEIGDYSWFSYGAIYEFLCMSKPIIHHRDDAKYEGKVESLYPMYSASNGAEVLKALKDCFYNKVRAETIARESNRWYLENAIEKPLIVIEEIIKKKETKAVHLKRKINLERFKISLIFFYVKMRLKIIAWFANL